MTEEAGTTGDSVVPASPGEQVRSVLLVTGLVAGGVGRHVAQLADGLRRRGVQVHLACPDVVCARFDLDRSAEQVHPVDIGARPHPLRDRQAIRTLREAMATPVDVVHAHGLRAGALSVLAAGARAERTVPVLVTQHNAAPHGRLAAAVHRGLERVVAQRADAVLGVSADLVARSRDLGAPGVERAVVAAIRAEPSRTAAQVRAELEISQDTVLVVAVGRLATQKGFDRLIEAFGDPVLRETDHLVVIAGDGPLRERLQREIDRTGSAVRLLGHRDDVADLLGAADIALSTARWEGQPVWLQEALSVGAALVVTDVGGTAEVVGDAAALVDPERPQQLIDTLAELLGDPERRTDLRRASLDRAGELPTGDDAVEAALRSYGRALARSQPGSGVD